MKKIGGNAAKIRRINRELVMEALAVGEASIAQLARETGLSVATCSNIMSVLVKCGEALELSEKESQGGRPARRYRRNPDATLVAAILLKKTVADERIACHILNAAGTELARKTSKFSGVGPEQIDAVLEDLKDTHPALKAVAFSVPGVVRKGIVGICELKALTGMNLEERTVKGHELAVRIDNDMNFAAMGYFKSHAGDGGGLVFMLFPENGCPGAGIIVNGSPLSGKSNFAGEIGFIPLPRRWESRKEGRRRKSEIIANTVIAVAAVVNPETIVIAREGIGEEMLSEIREFCREALPSEHLPEIVFADDYDGHILAGMTAMALESATSGMQLVER